MVIDPVRAVDVGTGIVAFVPQQHRSECDSCRAQSGRDQHGGRRDHSGPRVRQRSYRRGDVGVRQMPSVAHCTRKRRQRAEKMRRPVLRTPLPDQGVHHLLQGW